MIKPAPLKPFPFRALSPCHATEMQLDYLLHVVEAASKYGFNAIQICGATHDDIGNLDGLTEFSRFAKAKYTFKHISFSWFYFSVACRAAGIQATDNQPTSQIGVERTNKQRFP